MRHFRPINLDRMNEFPSYKGGCTCIFGGYVWEFSPGHRLQNLWGWVAQHRLVAEDVLGRPLRQSRDPKIAEHVHHRDGDRTNNDPANLEVMTKSQHHSHESKKYFDEKYASVLTHENALKALEGRTIREAAAHLGVTHMTLRRRCPEAVAPRKRRKPSNPSAPEKLELLRQCAADQNIGYDEATRILRMGFRTIRKACSIHGIQWVQKTKVGMLHRTYRGKPTPRALALRASGIDPESTRVRHLRRKAKHEPPRPSVPEEAG